MKLSMVVARSVDNVIGVGNTLPWDCPPDLINFKAITSRPNTAIVMGRNTWNSLPKKPLPNRLNIVVTTQPHLLEIPPRMEDVTGQIPNLVIVRSIEDAIQFGNRKELLGDPKVEELIFIGGAQIYEAVKGIVNEVHLTTMNLVVGEINGDKTVFDHEFVSYQYPDPENVDWVILDQWICYEDGSGKELFEYQHLHRK